ncbi:MAG: hypothetical protein GY716_13220 [bacterium]|nr:hypothetical protein [bacterium]
MRPVQHFSDEYLEQARKSTPDEIARFLESFRRMHAPGARSRLISMKVPEPLLDAFRLRCKVEGARYQTKIKQLMREWLESDRR